ncbi:MAG: YrzI family small protein [Tuberibacillus sp.]
MTVSLFALTFTITVRKRKSTPADVSYQERLKKAQDQMIDQRVNHRIYI